MGVRPQPSRRPEKTGSRCSPWRLTYLTPIIARESRLPAKPVADEPVGSEAPDSAARSSCPSFSPETRGVCTSHACSSSTNIPGQVSGAGTSVGGRPDKPDRGTPKSVPAVARRPLTSPTRIASTPAVSDPDRFHATVATMIQRLQGSVVGLRVFLPDRGRRRLATNDTLEIDPYHDGSPLEFSRSRTVWTGRHLIGRAVHPGDLQCSPWHPFQP